MEHAPHTHNPPGRRHPGLKTSHGVPADPPAAHAIWSGASVARAAHKRRLSYGTPLTRRPGAARALDSVGPLLASVPTPPPPRIADLRPIPGARLPDRLLQGSGRAAPGGAQQGKRSGLRVEEADLEVLETAAAPERSPRGACAALKRRPIGARGEPHRHPNGTPSGSRAALQRRPSGA